MTRVKPWIRAHAPTESGDVVGQERAVATLVAYVRDYTPGAKPLLLYGPPGTGKTSSVYAVAAELDLEVIELNASDKRNKAAVESLLGAALGQQSLFAKGKIILVDEADGLSGNSDRGGAQAVARLLEKACFPVVITANDVESKKLKALKKASQLVSYDALSPTALKTLLERVATIEGVKVEEGALASIAHRVGGDARAAVNDLQTLSGGKALSKADVAALGDREQKESVRQALLRVFKTTSADVALPAFDNVDENVDQLFLWVDENLPREYKKAADLSRAYDALAEADKFFGRIKRRQYYRFYVYIYNLLTAGVAIAKETKYPGVTTYKRPGRLLQLWIAKQRHAKKNAIAEKLGVATHASTKRALQEVSILKHVYADKRAGTALSEALDLDVDEEAWMQR